MNFTTSFREGVLLSVRNELDKKIPMLKEILSGTDFAHLVLIAIEEIELWDEMPLEQLCYLKELSEHLIDLPGESSAAVEELLCYMNFNSKEYLDYKVKTLKENINSRETVHQQLSQTKWLLKRMKQQVEHPDFHYDPNQRSVKTIVSEWLENEREYLEYMVRHSLPGALREPLQQTYPEISLESLWQPLPESLRELESYNQVLRDPLSQRIRGPLPEQGPASFKVKVNLTVQELACLVRLLIESEVIASESRLEFIDFIVTCHETNDGMELSSEILQKYMYDVSNAVKDSVSHLLIKLIDGCEEEKMNLSRTKSI